MEAECAFLSDCEAGGNYQRKLVLKYSNRELRSAQDLPCETSEAHRDQDQPMLIPWIIIRLILTDQ